MALVMPMKSVILVGIAATVGSVAGGPAFDLINKQLPFATTTRTRQIALYGTSVAITMATFAVLSMLV